VEGWSASGPSYCTGLRFSTPRYVFFCRWLYRPQSGSGRCGEGRFSNPQPSHCTELLGWLPTFGLDAVEKADSPIRSLVTVPTELPGCLRSRSALPFPFALFAPSAYTGVQSSERGPMSEIFMSEIIPSNATVYTYTVTSLTGSYIARTYLSDDRQVYLFIYLLIIIYWSVSIRKVAVVRGCNRHYPHIVSPRILIFNHQLTRSTECTTRRPYNNSVG